MTVETGRGAVLVTNIQRYSLNDGPGIRTTVFLKGCPLRCYWCHNPECIHPYADLQFIKQKCTACGLCVAICPEHVVATPDEVKAGIPKIDREKCTLCMKCVKMCKYGALVQVGKLLTVEEVLAEVVRDRVFYMNSGGGLTVSGGEPMFHPGFTLELLKRAQEEGVNTCLDTCGYADWNDLGRILDYVDIVLYDIKHMDSQKHKEGTGVRNELILENAERTARKTKMIIRIPVVPGFNDSEENMKEVARFARSLGKNMLRCDLLPFHNWASSKYESLGWKYACANMEFLSTEAVKPFEEIFKSYGLPTSIGG